MGSQVTPVEERLRVSFVVSAQPTGFAAVALRADLPASFERISAVGYDGVELAIREPASVDAEALARLAERHGLAIPALGTGQAFVDEGLSLTDGDAGVRRRAVERLLTHVSLSGKLGRPHVIVGLLRGRSAAAAGGREKALALLVEGLKPVADTAGAAGIRVALEPLNRYETDLVNTLDEGAEVADRVGEGVVGLLPDTFHMNIEEANPAASLAAHAPRVLHFHVADSNRWAPGHGHIDFAGQLAALTAGGYTGFVSVECLPKPERTPEAAIVTLRRLRLGRKLFLSAERGGKQP